MIQCPIIKPHQANLRFPSLRSAKRVAARVVMAVACGIVSAWCTSPFVVAAAPVLNVFTRTDERVSGQLTGDQPEHLKLIRSDGVAMTLDQIRSVDLPVRPRPLPDRGWRRALLVTGDVVHLRARPPITAPQGQPEEDAQPVAHWFADWGLTAAAPVEVPPSSIAALAHLAGSRCLVYEDFESAPAAWKNPAGQTLIPSRDQHRSGNSSLKCSPEQPVLRYNIEQTLPQGCLEFSFYLDPQAEPRGPCMATLRFSGAQSTAITLGLLGRERWYDVTHPESGRWSQQNVLRQPGWHTARVHWQGPEIQIAIDEFQVVQGLAAAEQPWRLAGIDISSTLESGAVWFDDVALVEPAANSRVNGKLTRPLLQRETDQLDLQAGDQLFGKFMNHLKTQEVHFAVNSKAITVPWSDVSELQFAPRRRNATMVSGWIVGVELQPWMTYPGQLSGDTFRGALQSADADGCRFEHPLCGMLAIPWSAIQRIRPAYHGQDWMLEGRPRHLGNEIKTAFAAPVPEGTELKWAFDLTAVPAGETYVALTAVDLEPAAPGTREHPWLKALRAGALTSELWVNDRRISVLNQAVTGRGIYERPRELRIRLPDQSLLSGKNEVMIKLRAGSGPVREFDDWELQSLRLQSAANSK